MGGRWRWSHWYPASTCYHYTCSVIQTVSCCPTFCIKGQTWTQEGWDPDTVLVQGENSKERRGCYGDVVQSKHSTICRRAIYCRAALLNHTERHQPGRPVGNKPTHKMNEEEGEMSRRWRRIWTGNGLGGELQVLSGNIRHHPRDVSGVSHGHRRDDSELLPPPFSSLTWATEDACYHGNNKTSTPDHSSVNLGAVCATFFHKRSTFVQTFLKTSVDLWFSHHFCYQQSALID